MHTVSLGLLALAVYLHRLFSLVLLLALLAAFSSPAEGRVRRRVTVRSNPPGALVFVDDYEIGTTPCSFYFTYYGTRKVRLVKSGYETLTVMQPFPAPWYEFPGIDFVSENLVPREIRDERTVNYNLTPQLIVPTDILLQRAEDLRRNTQAPGLAPSPLPPIGPTIPPAFRQGIEILPPAGPPLPEALPPGGRPLQ